MTRDDHQVIVICAATALDRGTAIFDGLHAYFHRALLDGRDPV